MCNLCPRKCNVNRKKGELGYCRMPSGLYVAKIMMHKWEEPFISGIEYGKSGTGAIFFYGCNLSCVYCQNYKISNNNKLDILDKNKYLDVRKYEDAYNNKLNSSKTNKRFIKYTPSELAKEMLKLEKEGAHTISLISGAIYIDYIKKTLELAKKYGLKIPIVYNSSGYESVESLKMLNGLVDIYLPDFKYGKRYLGDVYSGAMDYIDIAKLAIDEMYRQVKKLKYNKDGSLKKGLIVRHLLLPGQVEGAKKILKYLYEKYGDNIYFSIMNQYTPTLNILMAKHDYGILKRKIGHRDYDKIISYAIELGINNAFYQEDGTNKKNYIPDFN